MSLIIIVTSDRVDRLRRPVTTTITTITSATALSLPPSSFLPSRDESLLVQRDSWR